MAAIIKVGLAAANESGGQKGNMTSYIGGQLPGAKVRQGSLNKTNITEQTHNT